MRVLLLVLLVGAVAAHVPRFSEAGPSAEQAIQVDDPAKSWVFYDQLAAGEEHWYRFDAEAGMTIYVSVLVPGSEDRLPASWLVGPGLPETAPPGSPPATGAIRLPATGEVDLEPFAPQAMTDAGDVQTAAEQGTYYVLVRADEAVDYSLAIGREERFTAAEWVQVGVQRIPIQSWGGVPWFVTVSGEVIALFVAAALRRGEGVRRLLGSAGAALVAGTGLSVLVLTLIGVAQAGLGVGVLIPGVFAAASAGAGYGAWRLVSRGGSRWAVSGFGAMGIAIWAGLLIGPALLVVWSLWPVKTPGEPVAAEADPGPATGIGAG